MSLKTKIGAIADELDALIAIEQEKEHKEVQVDLVPEDVAIEQKKENNDLQAEIAVSNAVSKSPEKKLPGFAGHTESR